MKRVISILFLAVALAGALHAGSGGRLLLICNKADDTISFVDAKTLEVLGLTTTGRGPHEVAVSPDGKWAYVANYEGPGNSISLIDVKAMKEVRKIPIGPHRAPHGIVVNKNGSKLYATCERTQTVIEMDTRTEEIVRSFSTDASVSHMIALTPDEKKAYVANIGSGSVTAIDLVEGAVVAHIETGAGCEGIDVTPDGRTVWASNREAGTVSVIDTRSDEVVATLECPGFPIRVKAAPNGKLVFVSCARSNDVAVFDTRTREQVTRIATGTAPIGVLIEPGGKRAFVANTRANTVTVLDLEDYSIMEKITAGNTPDGLAFIPRGW